MKYEVLVIDDRFRFKICALEKNGRCDIQHFMNECKRENIALFKRILSLFDIIGKHGKHPNEEIIKQVRKGLFELKPSGHRMYYFCMDGDNIVFVHAAKKGPKNTQTNDIDKAQRIKEEFLQYKDRNAKS